MVQQNNRNSPHLSNHLQSGSAPPSISNAAQQQQGVQARQLSEPDFVFVAKTPRRKSVPEHKGKKLNKSVGGGRNTHG
ncbi:hypothetical protein BDZ45DRAFT_678009 [Acephala macrosclerotiorum]|nr:hypothetical protein BDZ45DRAFT_678009 [Acephala macrosclerotiorum]